MVRDGGASEAAVREPVAALVVPGVTAPIEGSLADLGVGEAKDALRAESSPQAPRVGVLSREDEERVLGFWRINPRIPRPLSSCEINGAGARAGRGTEKSSTAALDSGCWGLSAPTDALLVALEARAEGGSGDAAEEAETAGASLTTITGAPSSAATASALPRACCRCGVS